VRRDWCSIRVNFCATSTKRKRDFDDERAKKRTGGRYSRSERKLLMNKDKRGILERPLQRRLSGGPRPPRKDWSRAMEGTFEEEIGDSEITANDSFTRTEALLHAALRVWELKHGFRD
jgi:hypothetical protein